MRVPRVIAVAFIVGGVVILLVERFRPAPVVFEADQTPVPRAFAVGVCQMLALMPGVSRSGATIMGGLLMGLDRPAAAEFSFFLAMPTMVGAFLHDLWEVRDHLAPERGGGDRDRVRHGLSAALVVVKPFLRFVARSGFAPFAWYRIAAGLAIFVAMWRGMAVMPGCGGGFSPASSSPFRWSSACSRWSGSSVSLTV